MALDLARADRFVDRHIGPSPEDVKAMLQVVGAPSLDALIAQTVPGVIRSKAPLATGPATGEHELLAELRALASQNQVWRSFIGQGYSDTLTPLVVLRNIVQNPGWYTAYTPYQAEISQGRLQALLNYQTMVVDLTGMEISNASLLDEGTAAAEAMHLMQAVQNREGAGRFFVADDCHPQTVAVVRTRAEPLGIVVDVGNPDTYDFAAHQPFGALLQYPSTDGAVRDYRAVTDRAHAAGGLVAVASDLLSLTLLTPPGEWGADVVLGNSQRFGVPLGYGGPHAAFFATRNAYARHLPGRLIGVSEDANGRPALRMALQTREQHIRREKATSNICTAQVLLAVVASMYAVYHGPRGLKAIAERVHALTATLAHGLEGMGVKVRHGHFFDTLRVDGTAAQVKGWLEAARARRINLRVYPDGVGVALDEATTPAELEQLLSVFAGRDMAGHAEKLAQVASAKLPAAFARTTPYLSHPVFNRYHSETEMLRYMRWLESKDLSLTQTMIPLGSCTMKLNATAEMEPITWPEFNRLHPFAPVEQAAGYQRLFADLERALCEVTGFAGCSLQPNAGSQGEYAGLLVIRAWHLARGQAQRNVCLIPHSAHGTNPASAVMAGMKVVVVATDAQGNVDVADLVARAEQYKDTLAALMVTYPSTHGVFEEQIAQICQAIHERGGQVYMDGANLNAQVGVSRPGDMGADVCHINLHKTFCIPHGGGGPGMGPICVAAHLAPFLPGHPVVKTGGEKAIGPVSAAPWGSASILPISWMYARMMGGEGLTYATQVAILNANYVAARLEGHFPVLYRGNGGRVAHECILDTRKLKQSAGIEVEDIAKRLMDYGFHAPTVSFPVAGTLMVEPTESESRAELDRFVDAMISIRNEIREIEEGRQPREGNVLKHAPHTSEVVTQETWNRPYSRAQAAFPTAHVRGAKVWPSVGRVNNVLGDRKLVCSCPPMEAYQDAPPAAARA
jgi:glycine dehydrogenase